jgi:isoleucyl-tRNA synthetase
VLSTALFDKPPFKNLIVNGLVLAEDGKKMSKRLKNYPDPSKVMNMYATAFILLGPVFPLCHDATYCLYGGEG